MDKYGRRTFSEVRDYCVDLLVAAQDPHRSHASETLPLLFKFLQLSSQESLHLILDFVMLPLLLLLDAAVECRSLIKAKECGKKIMPVSDKVAEGVLQCLEELLKKCYLGCIDQMITLLKKLSYGAMLSSSEASEEFRGGIIRCFMALILNLQPCPDISCTCKHIKYLHNGFGSKKADDSMIVLKKREKRQSECLLSFLRSPAASPAIGHWISLLFKVSVEEVGRGHQGCGRLRAESYSAFRALVAQVASAEALAFFLPGVVSHLVKNLHFSKTVMSGAAGNVEAIHNGVMALAEFLTAVLQDDFNLLDIDPQFNTDNSFKQSDDFTWNSFLKDINHISIDDSSSTLSKSVINETSDVMMLPQKSHDMFENAGKTFHVNRTKDWLEMTVGRVNVMLRETLPYICVHPAKKVRLGLLSCIQMLLSKCRYTLRDIRLILLECLCVLVCDDSEEVCNDAQMLLEVLTLANTRDVLHHDIAKIFTRLVEKLPNVMLGNNESTALSHTQQLLAVIYYSGPQFLVDHLHSPIAAENFFETLSICFSQNVIFSGSLGNLLTPRTVSTGYLQSITELNTGIRPLLGGIPSFRMSSFEDKVSQSPGRSVIDLPRAPPWFVHDRSHKLYQTLAWIPRLVGLAFFAGFNTGGSLSIIAHIPLTHLRNLISEIHKVKQSNDSDYVYIKRYLGQFLRQASTSVSILNEVIFGMSDKAVNNLTKMFHKSRKTNVGVCKGNPNGAWSLSWRIHEGEEAKRELNYFVGIVLHEYLSSELWDLQVDGNLFINKWDGESNTLASSCSKDISMLQQVIIEGVGICCICLGKDFCHGGFLQSSLYLLLEKLLCSNFQIKNAADAVLRMFCATLGIDNVGNLVVENADYIIDSMCRQLRHLDINPHAPDMLASVLSYVGAAKKILPLLEEPMHSVSIQLEILNRHRHPELTLPFLKAAAEIVKATRREALSLPAEVKSKFDFLKSKFFVIKDNKDEVNVHKMPPGENEAYTSCTGQGGVSLEEQLMTASLEVNDFRRYRRTVASVTSSCLTAATPLLGSMQQSLCLVALDIIEDGVAALKDVEEACGKEVECREAILQVVDSHSLHNIRYSMDATENDGGDENRLLPAANKIWPFLIVCLQSKNHVAVRRCLSAISSVVRICGGDFFSRRFYTDGSHLWKLLTTSLTPKKLPLRLPYRAGPGAEEHPVSETSNLKVQAAVLNMVAELSSNKRSSSAMEAVLKKASGLVVAVVCSGVAALQEPAVRALVGLSSVDPDLIWLLLADVCYSAEKKNGASFPPPRPDFPELWQVLPPPVGRDNHLYLQYGGQSFGFHLDFESVEMAFNKLNSLLLEK